MNGSEDNLIKPVNHRLWSAAASSIIRIPREIREFYSLEKGDVVELKIKISAEDKRPNREIPMELHVVERESE